MRTKLVFPPRTGPTYMPLGVACLEAVAAQTGIEVGFFDANADLWNHLCDNDRQLNSWRNFCQSPLELFLQQELYDASFRHMPTAKRQIDRLEQLARIYLEKDELAAELAALLLRQSIIALAENPETVAFSVMYIDQLAFALALAKYLRTECRDGRQLIFGGAAMSAISPVELMTAFPFVDAILTGEGEIPFQLFLQKHDFAAIPGCYYRDGGAIEFSGQARYVKELASLPPPDFSRFSLRQYFNPIPVMPILGGRGCKWRRCRFCSHNNSFGPYRERHAFDVVREMRARQEQFGCRHFYFADQYGDPLFLGSLSDTLLAANFKCQFHVMARTVKDYTPELLFKAAAAGCCWISWGMESGSQQLLDSMNKGTRADESLAVIKNAAAAGISNLLMMIFGAPGSRTEYLEETFAFMDQVYPHIDCMTASAFVLFDHTAYSRNPAAYGLRILGKNVIFNVHGHLVHDLKLRFNRVGEYGSGESPLAASEIETWERRKVWLEPLPFLSRLCCEHYLLYAESIKSGRRPRSFGLGA